MKGSDRPRAWKNIVSNPEPASLTSEFEVQGIKERRWNNDLKCWEWLVEWVGYSDCTWEPLENLEGANLFWYDFQDKHPYPSTASDKPLLRTRRRQL